MTKNQVSIIGAAIAMVGGVAVAVVNSWQHPPATTSVSASQPNVLQGVVLIDDANPAKRHLIQGVRVASIDGLANGSALTGSDGVFKLQLKPEAKNGIAIQLNLSHQDFQERDILEVFGEGTPYVFYLWPKNYTYLAPPSPRRSILNFFAVVEAAPPVGSRIFQVQNRGSVRCNGQPPCSPDGKWKAAVTTVSLDANAGRVFMAGRTHADCIAGPCPWTKIEMDGFSRGGRTISVSIRNWSDTVTYKLWGEMSGP